MVLGSRRATFLLCLAVPGILACGGATDEEQNSSPNSTGGKSGGSGMITTASGGKLGTGARTPMGGTSQGVGGGLGGNGSLGGSSPGSGGTSGGSVQGSGGTSTGGLSGVAGTGPEWMDLSVFYAQDLNGADTSCKGGTVLWNSQLASLIFQTRQCQIDDDCAYVSFSDGCAIICPVPLNKYRVGELGTKLYGLAADKCATCPTFGSSPCSAPASVLCSNGLCQFQH